MNAYEIMKQWLDDNEFDGLCCDKCGCLKNDLFPCGAINNSCQPGYKVFVDGDWKIVPEKPVIEPTEIRCPYCNGDGSEAHCDHCNNCASNLNTKENTCYQCPPCPICKGTGKITTDYIKQLEGQFPRIMLFAKLWYIGYWSKEVGQYLLSTWRTLDEAIQRWNEEVER